MNLLTHPPELPPDLLEIQPEPASVTNRGRNNSHASITLSLTGAFGNTASLKMFRDSCGSIACSLAQLKPLVWKITILIVRYLRSGQHARQLETIRYAQGSRHGTWPQQVRRAFSPVCDAARGAANTKDTKAAKMQGNSMFRPVTGPKLGHYNANEKTYRFIHYIILYII